MEERGPNIDMWQTRRRSGTSSSEEIDFDRSFMVSPTSEKTQEQIYESVAWDNEAYPNTIVPRRTGSTTHSEGADGHGSPLPSMTQRVKETSHGYSRNATKESQSRPRGETMQNR